MTMAHLAPSLVRSCCESPSGSFIEPASPRSTMENINAANVPFTPFESHSHVRCPEHTLSSSSFIQALDHAVPRFLSFFSQHCFACFKHSLAAQERNFYH